jgi:hypothetical protein
MLVVVLMAQLVWKLPITNPLLLKLNSSPEENELISDPHKTIIKLPT